MREKRLRKSKRDPEFVYEIPGQKKSKKLPKKLTVQNPARSLSPPNNQVENLQMSQPPSLNPSQKANLSSPIPKVTNQVNSAIEKVTENSENESNSDSENNQVESDPEVNKAIDTLYNSFGSAASMSAGIQKFVRRKRSLSLHKQRKTVIKT